MNLSAEIPETIEFNFSHERERKNFLHLFRCETSFRKAAVFLFFSSILTSFASMGDCDVPGLLRTITVFTEFTRRFPIVEGKRKCSVEHGGWTGDRKGLS